MVAAVFDRVSSAKPGVVEDPESTSLSHGPTPRSGGKEVRQRLVVELNTKSAVLLDELVEMEELNKTTVVNRAIQVYAILRKAEASGGQVLISESMDSEPQLVRFV